MNRAHEKLMDYAQHKTLVFLCGLLLLGLLGIVDYATGSEISFSIFYLLPIVLVGSKVGLATGCVMAVLSAGMWMTADLLAGQHYSHPMIPYWNAGVRLGFFVIIVVMLHVRKKTEAALRDTQGRFASLFEFAPDPLVVVDDAGIMVQANERVSQTFGYSRKELIGTPVEILLAERFRSQRTGQAAYIGHPEGQRLVVASELCGRRRDGSEFPVEIIQSRMDAGGHSTVIVVIRDISSRRQLEEALRRERAGSGHQRCEEQMMALKREINELLNQLARPKRYDV